MEMISPPYLRPADTVAIVAPARKVSPHEVEPAISLLRSWGLEVVLGPNLYSSCHQFAGADAERAADLQLMIDSPRVRAILCARGGYGTVRLLEHMNFRALQRSPKWIIGYSDITVLHGLLNSWFMVETIHGAMPINFPADGSENQSTRALRELLFGAIPTYSIPAHPMNRQGRAWGQLAGGNLSLMMSLAHTQAEVSTDGKILFIEDLDEYLYHLDRMMMSLKVGHRLANLAGLVVGSLSGMRDNTIPFGRGAEAIVLDAVKEYDYPVCFGFPAGHTEPNLPLIMGRKAHLTIDAHGVTLAFG